MSGESHFDADATEADVETLQSACEEGRRTFEYQVERLREIDSKAIEILKANLLIIGVLVTALSIAVQSGIDVSGVANPFTIGGAVLLLLSTAIAGVTYNASNVRGGIGRGAIERILAEEYTEREFYEVLARSYGEWIEYNSEVTAVNDILITVTVVLVIDAFLFLTVGVVVAFVDPPLLVTVGGFLAMTAALGVGSWIVYQLDHINQRPDA